MKAFLAVLALSVLFASAQSQSLCDKWLAQYDIATSTTNTPQAFLGAAVDAVLLALGNVTQAPTVKRYFDGTRGVPSTNYLAGGSATTALRTKLIQFFGITAALNCTGYNTNYTGTLTPNGDFATAHAYMKISAWDFTLFNKLVANVLNNTLQAIGYNAATATAETTAVYGVLNSLIGITVFRSPVCDKYSDIFWPLLMSTGPTVFTPARGPNIAFLETFITAVFTNITTAGSPIKKYFDGTAKYVSGAKAGQNLPNYLTATNTVVLVKKLAAFFGAGGVLNCTDPEFIAYASPAVIDLTASHAPLGITLSEATYFNTVIRDIALGFQVPEGTAIFAQLNSLNGQVVAPAAPTTTTTTTATTTTTPGAAAPKSPASAVASSAVLAIVALLVALLF